MRCLPFSPLFLLLPLLLAGAVINGFLVPTASCGAPPLPKSSMHFKLFRKLPNATRAEHVRQIVRSDQMRAQMIADRMGGRRRATEQPPPPPPSSSFEMPISSAAFTGTGQYFVRFQVGTPAQGFLLVVDTGSDLTWMKCQYRACQRCRDRRRRGVFRAYQSSSFVPVQCSSQLCKNTLPFSLTRCPTSASPCAYDYVYADRSRAHGVYANEEATITLSGGRRDTLKGLIVGCTSSSTGSSFRALDGVLGLGYSKTSFAALAASRFGGKFSYCLVDHLSPRNASDYLVFGENAIHTSSRSRRYAELIMDPRLVPFYAVRVVGISVGGDILNISRVVWDSSRGGGVILDSGTSLTLLAQPAYQVVMAALSKPLGRYPRVEMKPFEFCFHWNGAPGGFDEAAVPRLVVHLAGAGGGVVPLKPPVKSYVIDVADGVKCIGVLSSSWPGVSTIGNILQQNHLWEFDIANKRLGFEPSSCSPK